MHICSGSFTQVSEPWPVGLLDFITFFHFFNIFFSGLISIRIDTLWAQLILPFSTVIFKLCILVLHGLKMCMWFWGYSAIFFFQLFPLFSLSFFRCNMMMWVSCMCNFSYISIPLFETFQVFLAWSPGLDIILNYCHFFCFLSPDVSRRDLLKWVYPSVDTMRWVACGHNSAYSFIPICLKLCRCFCHGLKMCMRLLGLSSHFLFINFFKLFLLSVFQVRLLLDTLWAKLLEFSIDHFETMHTYST